MSWSMSIGGHTESAEDEAEIRALCKELAEKLHSRGDGGEISYASFGGSHSSGDLITEVRSEAAPAEPDRDAEEKAGSGAGEPAADETVSGAPSE